MAHASGDVDGGTAEPEFDDLRTVRNRLAQLTQVRTQYWAYNPAAEKAGYITCSDLKRLGY